MNPVFFLFFTQEDGNDVDETLSDKLDQFMTDLRESTPLADGDIVHHHFIQHSVRGILQAPKSMRVTIRNKAVAEAFLKVDTQLTYGSIPAKHKRPHQEVSIKRCSVCQKLNHRI